MKAFIILFSIFFFIKINLLFPQQIDGDYALMKACDIKIINKKNDSIFCIGGTSCYTFNIDITIYGVWTIYSEKDTSTILQQVRFINGLKSGKEYLNTPLGRFLLNYNKGLLNGPCISYSTKGQITSICNYYMGVKIDNRYRYFYNEKDELISIEVFNKKNKLKKIIHINH